MEALPEKHRTYPAFANISMGGGRESSTPGVAPENAADTLQPPRTNKEKSMVWLHRLLAKIGIKVRGSAYVIPVDFYVVKDSFGRGNFLWSVAYQKALLREASLLIPNLTLRLRKSHVHESFKDYTENQKPLAFGWKKWSPGVVTVVVSGENTTDSVGFTFPEHKLSPIVVLRSRVQDFTGLEDTAKVLLQCLGFGVSRPHSEEYCKSREIFLY